MNATSTTSLTLLDHLVNPPSEPARQEAWARFVRLYAPLLLAWARAQRLQDADAANVVQEVLIQVFRKLPLYRRVEGYKFRGWLFTIARNKYQDFCRQHRNPPGADGLSGVEGPVAPDAVAEMDEYEYRLRLVREALAVVRADFAPETLAAFELQAVRGRSPAEAAAELGVGAEAARSAWRRVVARLRDELGDFLE